METFAQLWQGYWWLVFPLGAFAVAIVGKAGRSWERASKRRHQYRLERMRTERELRAAAPPASAVTVDSAAAQESQATQLAKLFATHDAVTARWLDYELDVAKLIAYPAMSDGRQPLTAAFLRAQRVADGLRPASPKARLTPEQLSEYRNAVVDYEVAFDVAERDARRVKDSAFSDGERKRLDTAKRLMSVAVDQAATPAERQVAYRRVREELDGLIALSDDAINVLETKVALELSTGRTTPAPEHHPESRDDGPGHPADGGAPRGDTKKPVPPGDHAPGSTGSVPPRP
ncbi:hypothetical protein ACFQZV_02900 [Microbacterium koreense]|uniref:Secreted protein n=1 Tax=Microbacterium koreense TaxID=323761 RepID=A0ABW2ZNQ4_9MICO